MVVVEQSQDEIRAVLPPVNSASADVTVPLSEAYRRALRTISDLAKDGILVSEDYLSTALQVSTSREFTVREFLARLEGKRSIPADQIRRFVEANVFLKAANPSDTSLPELKIPIGAPVDIRVTDRGRILQAAQALFERKALQLSMSAKLVGPDLGELTEGGRAIAVAMLRNLDLSVRHTALLHGLNDFNRTLTALNRHRGRPIGAALLRDLQVFEAATKAVLADLSAQERTEFQIAAGVHALKTAYEAGVRLGKSDPMGAEKLLAFAGERSGELLGHTAIDVQLRILRSAIAEQRGDLLSCERALKDLGAGDPSKLEAIAGMYQQSIDELKALSPTLDPAKRKELDTALLQITGARNEAFLRYFRTTGDAEQIQLQALAALAVRADQARKSRETRASAPTVDFQTLLLHGRFDRARDEVSSVELDPELGVPTKSLTGIWTGKVEALPQQDVQEIAAHLKHSLPGQAEIVARLLEECIGAAVKSGRADRAYRLRQVSLELNGQAPEHRSSIRERIVDAQMFEKLGCSPFALFLAELATRQAARLPESERGPILKSAYAAEAAICLQHLTEESAFNRLRNLASDASFEKTLPRDFAARLSLLEAQAWLSKANPQMAMELLNRVRDNFGDVPNISDQIAQWLQKNTGKPSTSALKTFLAQLNSGTATETVVYTLGGAIAGGTVAALAFPKAAPVAFGVGFVIGGALGEPVIRLADGGMANVVEAYRTNLSPGTDTEAFWNGLSLGAITLAALAPVKAMSKIGVTGLRTLLNAEARTIIDPALERVLARVGIQEFANLTAKEAAEKLTQAFFREMTTFGGRSLAAYNISLLVTPLATEVLRISQSELSRGEKDQAYRAMISGIGRSLLSIAVLHGANRIGTNPTLTVRGIRERLNQLAAGDEPGPPPGLATANGAPFPPRRPSSVPDDESRPIQMSANEGRRTKDALPRYTQPNIEPGTKTPLIDLKGLLDRIQKTGEELLVETKNSYYWLWIGEYGQVNIVGSKKAGGKALKMTARLEDVTASEPCALGHGQLVVKGLSDHGMYNLKTSPILRVGARSYLPLSAEGERFAKGAGLIVDGRRAYGRFTPSRLEAELRPTGQMLTIRSDTGEVIELCHTDGKFRLRRNGGDEVAIEWFSDLKEGTTFRYRSHDGTVGEINIAVSEIGFPPRSGSRVGRPGLLSEIELRGSAGTVNGHQIDPKKLKPGQLLLFTTADGRNYGMFRSSNYRTYLVCVDQTSSLQGRMYEVIDYRGAAGGQPQFVMLKEVEHPMQPQTAPIRGVAIPLDVPGPTMRLLDRLNLVDVIDNLPGLFDR